jgi:arsenate reductase
MLNILVLCTGNSCRSIMLEAILNHYGAGRVRAVSAGSHPAGYVHPLSLETLAQHGIVPENPKSQSWDEFTNHPLDMVITVCNDAAWETCPVFMGAPLHLHWGVPDPAKGTKADFEAVFQTLKRRAQDLLALGQADLTYEKCQSLGQD